ncbi:MAG: hypothetical protein HKM07_03815, partial [Chlamydiae bacterium]|nr:hypothetical protein [Chlamydiota bacterium]
MTLIELNFIPIKVFWQSSDQQRAPGNLVDVTKAYTRLPLDATNLVFSAITDPKQVSMQMVDETMALVDYIEKTT